MKRISSLLVVLCLVLCAVPGGGVWALWRYAEAPAVSDAANVGITLSEFVWAPEEILPSDTPGKNYIDLLDSVLENAKGGLNSSKDMLEKAVLRSHLVHSSQNVQGGNLKHLFTTQASQDLEFIVEYVTDEEFNVYMYESRDALDGLVGVTKIKVYKTIMVIENGKWMGRETKLGYATLQYFKDTNIVAIDATGSWVQGNLPT